MQCYAESLTEYKRLKTLEVKIGDLLLGNPNGNGGHPIRVQTMTTTDTMDTIATVEQSIRCIEAGAELVRITAPSKKEAENLLNIKNELRKRGYHTPLVADIHFTPNAAEIAARIVEKVRVNPGNYVDKKKFELIEYSDADYAEEIERIRERFTPLVKICKEYGTAMRIGTNHGSLSDRIMSRYGDTPMGMVESALEFLRIARNESYHNIVLSMKSSNPQVMVQAYRLLVNKMDEEFGACYPLHLGVTEAGDGEDGRIKSAIGIGTLLEDGLGDTIRVSLTEDPEFEIPVCKDLVKRYAGRQSAVSSQQSAVVGGQHENSGVRLPYNPFEYSRRKATEVSNTGGKHVPVVVADFMEAETISAADLQSIGYSYNEATDKWKISDAAADYIFTGDKILDFALPGTLKVICHYTAWKPVLDKEKYYPVFQTKEFMQAHSDNVTLSNINFVLVDARESEEEWITDLLLLLENQSIAQKTVLCIESTASCAMPSVRSFFAELHNWKIQCPVILCVESSDETIDEQLIRFSTEAGALMLDGMGDGIWLWNHMQEMQRIKVSGRTYLEVKSNHQFLNNTA
ncbi:MAG: (E)-4-hydroxy-3-methylbut-2-enyl-diphosphate synthase, partial [Chitinophagaceae bacterium]|nr:(E)-4-hydroxy-3-methylbut-2-enyl-diphosphate synthase [Chitinophagaceae bacterium]